MSHTYHQMYVQIVFTVNHRKNFIIEPFREELEKYICGIIKNKSCKPIAIYCNPDHIHILIGFPPGVLLSDLVRDIKCNSSKFINTRKIMPVKFSWQKGYGIFSYSQSQVGRVARYIENQPERHKKQRFKDEYINMLEKFGIVFDSTNLFQWFDK